MQSAKMVFLGDAPSYHYRPNATLQLAVVSDSHKSTVLNGGAFAKYCIITTSHVLQHALRISSAPLQSLWRRRLCGRWTNKGGKKLF